MKRKIISSFIIIVISIIIMQTKVHAKSYYIKDMDIQATVLENGDLEIEQTLEYTFNGNYNGIFITIPIKYEDKEKIKSEISDELYNCAGVELKDVSLVNENEQFKKVNSAAIGDSRVYTEEVESNIYKLKIFSPSSNTNKTFRIKYILKNVCVLHKDVSELYYNFIGGEWECSIKKLNIDIYLPKNEKMENLKIWGHGPDNGESKIIDNTHINLYVENIATGKYVAARIIFDKKNIPNTQKKSNIEAYNLILNDESKIAKISDRKQNYTKNVYKFALVLIIYWVILLIIYEKDKKYSNVSINEEELFEKYNPMVAGCLQGSRDILARDIIAVILNLIEKKNINIEIIQSYRKKEKYEYILTKVPEKEEKMDEIEKIVYNWIFESKDKVDLTTVLKDMPKNKEASKKFEKLNNMAQKELNNLGANQKKVPIAIRIFNTILFFVAICVSLIHILNEGVEIYGDIDKIFSMLLMCLCGFPMILLLMYVPLILIVSIRRNIIKLVHKITGQRVVTTAITIITIFLIIIILTVFIANEGNMYIIADEILICISLIIMLTDNLMLKNSVKMIEDYSKINSLKEKIENYTLMEDRDIEQVTIWGKYLAYAVSFGTAKKVSKRIKGLYLNDDLLNIINDKEIMNYIGSDYIFFYYNTNLDSRFMQVIDKMSSNYSSFGDGGGFSGGGGFSRRRRKPEDGRRSILTIYHLKAMNCNRIKIYINNMGNILKKT